ncbi:MAG: type II toxin-antitoxin system PemK/MazF family toxin [Planctomycetes bacterium]|nr:type II toxin-antitoxin system PemK/MazF family toxin [Planctomycetota bacterium]
MTKCDAGDIVLVRFPFTDFTTSKKRPAVIISPRTYTDRFGDVVLMPLTSQAEQEALLALSQWQVSGLLKPTWVKPIIGTLSTRLIERHLGKLTAADEQCIRTALGVLLANRWLA